MSSNQKITYKNEEYIAVEGKKFREFYAAVVKNIYVFVCDKRREGKFFSSLYTESHNFPETHKSILFTELLPSRFT